MARVDDEPGRHRHGFALSPATKMNVLLADDHIIFREGLRVLLEQNGMRIVGEAADGYEAVRLAQELRPDLAVLDLAMPLLNGIGAALEIKSVSASTRTVLLTAHTEEHL